MKQMTKQFNTVIASGRVLGAPRKTEKGYFITLGDGKEKADFFFMNNEKVNWHTTMPKLKLEDGKYIAIVGSESKDGKSYFANKILFPNATAPIYNPTKKEVGAVVYFGNVGKIERREDKVNLSLPVRDGQETKWLKGTCQNNEKFKLADNAEKFLGTGDLVLVIGSPINEQYNSTWVNSFNLIKKKTTTKE
jgi:hypothetical protein